VAWGNLSTFAATLKKGAHVPVEGELRYREFVPKKQKKPKNGEQKIRVAEIDLSKIAKLDRAEKHDSDERCLNSGQRRRPPSEGVSLFATVGRGTCLYSHQVGSRLFGSTVPKHK
jgi:single-stranded DNA-binding protein